MQELIANSPLPGTVASITSLASGVVTSPAVGTQETWTFAASPPAELCVAGGQFRFICEQEILLDITAATGTARTVLRGQEGSTVSTHSAGAQVFHDLTAGALTAKFASAALKDSPNTFTAPQVIQTTGTPWSLLVQSDRNAVLISSADEPPGGATPASPTGVNHDTVDVGHYGAGDGVYVQHVGGLLPAFSFTATTVINTPNLTAISSRNGLTKGLVVTGAGIPAGTTLLSVNPAANTAVMSANATASGAVTVAIAATTIGGAVGGFTCLVPYTLDTDGSTGHDGIVLNNRRGMKGLNILTQPTDETVGGINLIHNGGAPALFIDNQDTTQSPGQGNGYAIQVEDWGTGPSLQISRFGPPAANSGVIDINMLSASGYAIVVRTNDGVGDGHFHVDQAGAVAAASSISAGLNQTWLTQMYAGTAGAGGLSIGGLQLFKYGTVLRLSAPFTVDNGVGFWGHAAPGAQPAAPVTLGDVIAIVRGCGLSA